MTDLDFEQRVHAAFREMVDETTPAALRLSVNDIPNRLSRQSGPRTSGWGVPALNRFAPLALATTAVVVVLLAIGFFVRSTNIGPPAVPEATPTPSVLVGPLAWTGPVRTESEAAEVHVMELSEDPFELAWRDGPDAAVSWADITNIRLSAEGPSHWRFDLAGWPPVAAEIDRAETVIAYGLVLETNGDGVADYVVGIDNDAPRRGDLRVWVTDLATGDTDEHVGAPYGLPVEFSHPGEQFRGDPLVTPQMEFVFIPGTSPPGVTRGTRFYAWASVTEGDEVVAWDYAPDAAWLRARPVEELGCTPLACPMPGPASMPPGSRQLLVSVANASERRALLFVAEDEDTLGELVGTAAPAMVPAGMTSDVVFTVPPGEGWAIFVNPTITTGPMATAHDIPADASGRMPFKIRIVEGERMIEGPPPGWFGQ